MASSMAVRVRDAGYTPAIRDLGALLDLFAEDDEELARAAERAVLRIEGRHKARLVSETLTRASSACRPARGRLARLVGRLATGADESALADARSWLVAALGDADPKTRHAAARASARYPRPTRRNATVLEHALLEAWDRGADEDRRALAEALGKVGGAAARARLAAPSPDIAPRAIRAALMIDRSQARQHPGRIALTRAFEGPINVRFHSRTGLESIVAAELGASWRPRVAAPGIVDARLDGPLARVAAVRTALYFGFPCDPEPVRGELAEAIVSAILAPRSLAILRAFTEGDGPIRFRLAWARGGHRRALAWRCAELIAADASGLLNDPTSSTWEIVVDDHADRVAIELVPRAFVDERFAYREASVPASSHPTIAAALARMVDAHADDAVWDPFAGAGAELIERARMGPYRKLTGTDIDENAVRAARQNLSAAGVVDATLTVADATTFDPGPVSVILTNPPMGRRVQRGQHVELLERFVDHAAHVLVPGGALVWALPDPARVYARAARAGLVLERAFTVDMGGFPAEMSIHRKRR